MGASWDSSHRAERIAALGYYGVLLTDPARNTHTGPAFALGFLLG